ncbi:hypothetical protein [Subtercola endophyticus]|uniref:hypothetical protein n=1 Tax=Subtercola endophyticus TaxID=2895559 RepID=UPI001E36FE76|nr:hypothetical protein [Subtercola endophyticus]UFS59207.1 hypothetical protein LQ955_19895 [Subtercola endophyticus]
MRSATPSLRALRIEPESAELVHLDELRLLAAHHDGIAGTGYRSVTLESGIALLVDEDAARGVSTLNGWATIIAHTLGGTAVVFGSALAFGIDTRGQLRTVTTLRDDQLSRLARAVVGPPSAAVLDALIVSLAPHPGALAYLANLPRPAAPGPGAPGPRASVPRTPTTAPHPAHFAQKHPNRRV